MDRGGPGRAAAPRALRRRRAVPGPLHRQRPRLLGAPWDPATEAAFSDLLRAHEHWRAAADPADMVTMHLDGVLAVPALLSLRGSGASGGPRATPPGCWP
nr:hypothetical protein GCM10020093_073650 [Planobispora longispora]